ncbi:leukotriene B4 receptor 1-like [Protopterus annectens]|uniref:leukotriene B4 receptor 1-like n=1 Tax=Protopterus annectens TaxID=7888 RepID=UPI001CFAAF4D|nr:leukotriene B4 receptor 1-like [Protopterus annectens]XP_043914427.1 leukotriene B4 receptor 1-like [Protopterus annectens]XP_043914428.1 leukotriene B4 receptor 1-like [Protopterus annectens]XP_043914429.1 leukotriene B4 receptor 1-like [Protopterus annectens]XP_043914430.1 leukotriene B4 receptor 1-like [Protopterus annectens]
MLSRAFMIPSTSNWTLTTTKMTPVIDVTNATGTESAQNETVVSSHFSTTIGSTIMLLALIIGVPGNWFVVWSIVCQMRKRNVTCILILNLAIADGTIMLLTPFFIVYMIQHNWSFGRAICKIVYYLCCINMYASIFLIMLMSVDRLVAVTLPHLSHTIRKKKLVWKIICVLWAMSVLLAIPAVIYRDIMDMNDRNICRPVYKTNGEGIFHCIFEFVLAFAIPFIVILFSYSCIKLRLRTTRFKKRARTERLIVIIVAAFVILWLPYHIIGLIQIISYLYPSNKWLERIWLSCRAPVTAIAFVSSSVNPVLYAFAGTDLIKTAGMKFMVKLLEGNSDISRKLRSAKDGLREGNKDGSKEVSKAESMEIRNPSELQTSASVR